MGPIATKAAFRQPSNGDSSGLRESLPLPEIDLPPHFDAANIVNWRVTYRHNFGGEDPHIKAFGFRITPVAENGGYSLKVELFAPAKEHIDNAPTNGNNANGHYRKLLKALYSAKDLALATIRRQAENERVQCQLDERPLQTNGQVQSEAIWPQYLPRRQDFGMMVRGRH